MTVANHHHYDDCPRCADLEEQVAFLKAELGASQNASKLDHLKRAYRATGKESAILLTLYEAYPRTVLRYQLERATLDPGMEDERLYAQNLVSVYIVRLRKKLGKKSISTVFEQGYALTKIGKQLVDKALGDLA